MASKSKFMSCSTVVYYFSIFVVDIEHCPHVHSTRAWIRVNLMRAQIFAYFRFGKRCVCFTHITRKDVATRAPCYRSAQTHIVSTVKVLSLWISTAELFIYHYFWVWFFRFPFSPSLCLSLSPSLVSFLLSDCHHDWVMQTECVCVFVATKWRAANDKKITNNDSNRIETFAISAWFNMNIDSVFHVQITSEKWPNTVCGCGYMALTLTRFGLVFSFFLFIPSFYFHLHIACHISRVFCYRFATERKHSASKRKKRKTFDFYSHKRILKNLNASMHIAWSLCAEWTTILSLDDLQASVGPISRTHWSDILYRSLDSTQEKNMLISSLMNYKRERRGCDKNKSPKTCTRSVRPHNCL